MNLHSRDHPVLCPQCVAVWLSLAFVLSLGMAGEQAQRAGTAVARVAGESFTNGLGQVMIWVKAGEFEMGSPGSEVHRYSGETQHRVRLTKGYWLGATEVTQGEWEGVMGSNPSQFKGDGVQVPVETVSWAEAVEYCRKVTARERSGGQLPPGSEYRLPTEAQWEYACRAETTGPFCYGASLDSSMANFDGNYPDGEGAKGEFRKKTVAVRSFRPNGWGFYDMHGNVWEWCIDWYGNYAGGSMTDPTGPTSGSLRVFRGGGWPSYGWGCRSALRDRDFPGGRGILVGFRLALVAVP